jgi:hypothetical protein
MPRNPNKTHCQAPGCHNWAMRAHTHCRSHRDAELGPRGAGAPPGNLNALKTGQDAHPLSRSGLRTLAQQIASDPQQLPSHLQPAIGSIHARTRDPVKTLLALQAMFTDLLPLVAQNLFTAELETLLHQVPPQRRSSLQTIVWKQAVRLGPEAKLRFLRAIAAEVHEGFPSDDTPAPPLDEIETTGLILSPLEPFTPPPSSQPDIP